MENILSVRELNRKIRQVFEVKFPYIWVKGEVSNCARPSSGHLYFSLKDGDELLNCVWFKQSQAPRSFDPITGEVFEDGPKPSLAPNLREGQEIICAGKLSIYAPRGQYQLIVEYAEETGLGQLYIAFEKLKQKLSSEGLFDYQSKRVLPQKIENIAVITAPTGAVIYDFLRICQSRGKKSNIYLYPSLVQGADAPKMLIQALKQAEMGIFENNKYKKPDVIALIRGGGSIEDLWAFNSEELARAIYACPIPIITGIGHEPDQSIADYVADVRAATPSHVAQILLQDRKVLLQQFDDLESSIYGLVSSYINYYKNLIQQLAKNLSLLSPQNKLNSQMEQINYYHKSLQSLINQKVQTHIAEIGYLSQNLANISPNFIQYGEKIENIKTNLDRLLSYTLQSKEQLLENSDEKLQRIGKSLLLSHAQKLNNLELELSAQNPFSPLKKGYFLAEKLDEQGQSQIVRSIVDLKVHDHLTLNFSDGKAETKVEKIHPMN